MPPLFPVRLRWPAAPAETRYRVVLRNVAAGGLVTIEADEPSLLVDLPAPTSPDWPEWRVQVSDGGSWAEYLPYMEWPSLEHERTTVLHWRAEPRAVHRVVVRDDTREEIVLKAATLGTSYTLDWSRLDRDHPHRWKLQRWEGGTWTDVAPYESLRPGDRPAVAGERSAPLEHSPDVLFLFTSDTEVHLRWMAEPDGQRGIEQQIFGRVGGREVGIGLQMDLLDEHGFKGTFFVDVLAEVQFGDGSLQNVFDTVLDRGHDVQLHLHPNPHLRFAKEERLRRLSTATTENDPSAFRAATELAIDIFERRAGRLPVAYRAGAYRIYDSHFNVLHDLGIAVDSSINPFKNSQVAPWLSTRTQPFRVDGVLEVPITWHVRRDGERSRGEQLRPVKSAAVQREMLAATPASAGALPTTICYIAHSFSFLGTTRTVDEEQWKAWNARWEELVGPKERAISGYNVGAPLIEVGNVDERRIDVLREGLAELARRPSLAGISLAELSARRFDWDRAALPVDPLPLYDDRARRSRVAGARRYSASYLAQLESVA